MKYKVWLIFLISGIFVSNSSAQITIKDSTITWSTYSYSLNEDYTLESYSLDPADIVDTTFSIKVIESDLLKVMLLPEYGGRIISMVYKPTGHEQLYQNPVGTPYGWWFTGTFYYNWLMLYGGIFPTVPEPEHGKSWLMPWDFEVVSETSDLLTIKMSWADNVEYNQYARYGDSDIRMDFYVSVYSGSSALHTEVVLTNEGDSQQNFEYWTNASLAPGSTSGLYNARVNEDARLIIPAEKLKIPSWTQLLNFNPNVEESVPGERETYYFDALREFSNWDGSGSAFTRPEITENYWGVINGENNEGLIRISDNTETPFVKIWTFGYPTSKDIDPFNPDPSLTSDNGSDLYYYRPFIELWGGVSSEFNVPDVFEANSTRSWKEVYIPTKGLSDVTHASEEIVIELEFEDSSDEFLFKLFAQIPDQELTLNLYEGEAFIRDTSFFSSALGNQIDLNIDNPVSGIYQFSIFGEDQSELIEGDIEIFNTSTIREFDDNPAAVQLHQNYPNPFNPTTTISYSISEPGNVKLEVFDLIGRKVANLLDDFQLTGTHSINFDASGLSSGIYLVRLTANGTVLIKKATLLK